MCFLSGLFLVCLKYSVVSLISSMAASLHLSSTRLPRSVVWVAMLCGAHERGEFHPSSSVAHLQIEVPSFIRRGSGRARGSYRAGRNPADCCSHQVRTGPKRGTHRYHAARPWSLTAFVLGHASRGDFPLLSIRNTPVFSGLPWQPRCAYRRPGRRARWCGWRQFPE